MKLKVIALAAIVLGAYLLFSWIAPTFFPQFAFFGTTTGTWGFYLVVAFAILLAISGFLPYKWGKVLREVAYLLLFIVVLLTLMAVVAPFVHKIDVAISDCTNVFFPQNITENILYNAVDYTSCILTGYYPEERPETANVAWTTFYVFYLILPFAFIWTFIYGLMSSMEMGKWFGSFGKTATRLFSFIIAMYATRVLMGEVLLEFLGYGAWGLAAVFGAIFLVKGLQHMVEKWYGVEAMAAETRSAIEKERELSKASRESLRNFVNKCETLIDLNQLITPGQTAFEEIFKYLPGEMQAKVRGVVADPSLNLAQKKSRILAILGGRM